MITYDAIGNPLTGVNGYRLTWEHGRQLASVYKNIYNNAIYTYDDNGIRTGRTVRVNDVLTEYTYRVADGTLRTMTAGDETLEFVYGNGMVSSVIWNGNEYWYIRNAQNDVIGLIDNTGEYVVRYTYDAWGLPTSKTGTMADTIGTLNPFRYRGYIYDEDTGLYYLESRYYNPEWGRFVNADGVLTHETAVNLNLFAYCLNNPTNMADANGHLPFFVLTAIVGAVAGAIIGGVTAACNGGNVWAGIGIGAAAGALIGTGVGMAAGAALAGSITATTGAVMAGGAALVSTVTTGGVGAGLSYIHNNLQQAVGNIAATSSAVVDPVKSALQELNNTNLRPGQTEISRARVMEIVGDFDPIKATSSVFNDGGMRFLVDGHHTTVASTILNKGTCVNMGVTTMQMPSANNIYWAKQWYEFWKTAIKIVE